MSRIKKAVAAALIGCVLLSLVGFGGKCADIRQKVVRIHVLANSDSAEDQQLKLRVRDAVLSAADGLTEGCADREGGAFRAGGALPRAEKGGGGLPESGAVRLSGAGVPETDVLYDARIRKGDAARRAV